MPKITRQNLRKKIYARQKLRMTKLMKDKKYYGRQHLRMTKVAYNKIYETKKFTKDKIYT